MVAFSDIVDELKPDWALRDVYVLAADSDTWNRFLRWLRGSGCVLWFFVDGQAADLPRDFEGCLRLRQAASPLLMITVAGLDLACHFFWEGELELDFVPGELTPERWGSFLRFLTEMSEAVEKPVIVTPENCSSAPFLRAHPDGRVERLVAP